MQNKVTALFSGAGILVLILDGQTALSAAAAGVELCLKSVIPSLFPFLFFCSLLTDSLWGGRFPRLRPLARALGIPEGGECLLVSAFLGGYPAGAAAVGSGYGKGILSRQQAEHLLVFCSNAGPAFLFGIAARFFPERGTIWTLWAIQILSSMAVALLNPKASAGNVRFSGKTPSPVQTLSRTLRVMAAVCGWIVLFRILSEFLSRWFLWALPEPIGILITGLLEISNGCLLLGNLPSRELRFLICTALLSFGGLCVALQTLCVIGTLSIRPYLRGKVKMSIISLILAGLYLRGIWQFSVGIFFFLVILPGLLKKRGGFPAPAGV